MQVPTKCVENGSNIVDNQAPEKYYIQVPLRLTKILEICASIWASGNL